jgi:phosphopantothenoylcysteine decarboxylase/phosphopantothenate--cysteine ligase
LVKFIMKHWIGQRIIIGVTGGIAAYKTPELVRLLVSFGAEVKIVMSQAAEAFITALTLQAVSGGPVYRDSLEGLDRSGMDHIALARWADKIIIAPATAHCVAKLAHGFADDLLSTVCLATTASLYVAPAMNQQMWEHSATQANISLLRARGVHVLGPGIGAQACGEVGPGRMLEPEEILHLLPTERSLAGKTVLVTLGPTREGLDPVRFISNRSSGKMGFALAAEALALGAEVVAIVGPVKEQTPAGVRRIDVETAREMHHAVMSHIEACDIFIATAAVADYRPEESVLNKIKKNDAHMTLRLVRNPDILGDVGRLTQKPFCVGFSAETNQGLEFTRNKLKAKNCDLMVLNYVNQPGVGFDCDTNCVTVVWSDGQKELPFATKRMIANNLWTIIREQYEKNSG